MDQLTRKRMFRTPFALQCLLKEKHILLSLQGCVDR